MRSPLTAVDWLASARHWRECAMAMEGRLTPAGYSTAAVLGSIPYTRAECIRRARLCIYLARRSNRATTQGA